VEPHADAVRAALSTLDPNRRPSTRLIFTAHSIPTSMARSAGPTGGRYEAQLRETAGLVAQAAGYDNPGWDLVWQSRSGPPQVPWLEPDINDHLAALAQAGTTDVVVSPIGFVSDHLEVVWDLDTEAAATAKQLGLGYVRAGTPGADPRFVTMVRELVAERLHPSGAGPQRRLGTLPVWNACPSDCCAVKASPRG
jgi:ferrochelatase